MLRQPCPTMVRATCVRSGQTLGCTAQGRSALDGYILEVPRVGLPLVVFLGLHGPCFMTTAVRRVLTDPCGAVLYVETENSVYRLDLGGLG